MKRIVVLNVLLMVLLTSAIAQQQEKAVKTLMNEHLGIRLSADVLPYFINLRWRIPALDQTGRFELQRSPDSLNFITIKTFDAASYAADAYDYSYRDEFPLKGKNYYRLIAFDKFSTDSRTVEIKVDFTGEAKTIKPTLVVQGTQLRISGYDGERYQLLIYTSTGAPVLTHAVTSAAVNLSTALRKGVYVYQMHDMNKLPVSSGRFVVL